MEENNTLLKEQNVKTSQANKNKASSRARMILVIVFLAIFLSISYVNLRASYLEYLELGEKYLYKSKIQIFNYGN